MLSIFWAVGLVVAAVAIYGIGWANGRDKGHQEMADAARRIAVLRAVQAGAVRSARFYDQDTDR